MCSGGRVAGVAVREGGRRSIVRGDHYVAALPLERMAPLVGAALQAADPRLAGLRALAPNVEWMTGVQFFLHRDVPTTHGHVIHIDTEWALTSISQLQFWRSVAPAQFGSSDVRGVLSVDVSDWTAPGAGGRAAMHCTREEVVRETWRQLKRSINAGGELLRDEDLHSWFLDADIETDPARPGRLANSEPLLVNQTGTWALRPEATTAVGNLFLAADYVRTHTDLATMEGANEAARRAVNGLLDAAGWKGPRCAVWPLAEPQAFAPWRLHDAARWRAGLPWDGSLLQVAAHALRGASPLLDAARPLVEALAPHVAPLADALDLSDDGALEDPAEVRSVDPSVVPGSAYVPAPAPWLPAGPAAAAAGAAGAAAAAAGCGVLAGSGAPAAVARAGTMAAQAAADAVAGPAGFVERLGWYRGLLAPVLSGGVPGGEPQRHLYALVGDFVDRSGKGLRPALCIAAARALGGRTDDALPAAAGIEMLHNAFLVHDDIEDGSELRRGVPTLHRSAGLALAVNAGDAMNALAMRLLRASGERLGPAAALRLHDEVDHMLIETLEGQAIELGWLRDGDVAVGVDDYLRLVLKKTAWYSFIHPLRIGALVADGEDRDLGRFDRFGYLLGLAFQITDDVLNLAGSVERYGKEIDGDLWEGKRTLILAHALQHAGRADRAWIAGFLGRSRERRLPREVLRLHRIVESAGSIAWAARAAARFAQAAADEFGQRAFAGVAPGADLDWLRSSVDYLVRRDA